MFPETPEGCLLERAQLVKECREVQDAASAANRQLTAEDVAMQDKKFNRCRALKAEHDRLVANAVSTDRSQTAVLELDEMENELNRPLNRRITTPDGGRINEDQIYNIDADFDLPAGHRRVQWSSRQATRRHNHRFNIGGRRTTPEYRLAARQSICGPDRQILGPDGRPINATTIQTADDQRAGYFVLAEQMVAGILKNVDDDVWIQQRANVTYVRDARSVGIRKRTAKADSFNWGSELSDATLNLEQSLKYGKRVMTPHYLTGSFRLSRDLVRMADIDIEAEVIAEMMIDLREFIEAAYMTGNGQQRPLGVLTADAEGISTARDIAYDTSGGNTFTFNTLVKAKTSLKPKYIRDAVWLFHPDRVFDISTMRTNVGGANTGEYLWQPSRQVGEPDILLGLPVNISYFMPSATGSGAYFGMLADFSFYRVIIGLDMEMQRLIEMRARTNEFEYLFRMKLDAAPILEEAFIRLKYT